MTVPRAGVQHLLRLHPADNVLTVTSAIAAGDAVLLDGELIAIPQRLTLGHKVAARAISAGEKIIKYGVPIGSATSDIVRGAHVHTHNLKSDYLPTFRREDQPQFFAAQQEHS